MAETPFKVLLTIDSSENAEFAIKYYLDHIHKDGNELTLLHVAEMPHTSTFLSGTIWEEAVHVEKSKAIAVEKEYKALLEKRGLHGKIIALFGNKPGEVIVHKANEENVDLVVVGSRGLGKIRRTILGSVSDYVLHHAHCTVVVCKQQHHHGFHLFGHHHHGHQHKHGHDHPKTVTEEEEKEQETNTSEDK